MITLYDVTQHIVAAVEYLIVREWPFSYYDHVVQNEIIIYVIFHNFKIGKYYCCVRLFHRNSHFIQTSYNLKGSETRYITDLALC